MDIGHIGHVDMLTARVEESLDFFARVQGRTVCGRDDTKQCLRASDEYEFHNSKLIATEATRLRNTCYRIASAVVPEMRVAAIKTFYMHGMPPIEGKHA